MENLLEAILGRIDDNSLQAMSRQANATPTQTKSALASAIPILMNALAKNSNTQGGAEALQNALSRDHDGSLLDNLGSLLQDPSSANGSGILKHVLGNKRQNVEQYISNDSGVSGSSVGKILEMAAPIVMGYLGKKNTSGSSNAIGNLLNSYLNTEKKQAPQAQSVINQLLDRDNDGNVMDDIAELGMSFLNRRRKR